MRYKRLYRYLALGLLLGLFWWYQTRALQIHRVTITSSKINEPLRICQITDLHGASFGPQNLWLKEKIKQQQPDIIAVTGDMYTYQDAKGQQTALQLLTDLTSIAPVYYVSGEHDSEDSFSHELEHRGIHVMNYRDQILSIGTNTIHLYGINNQYYSPTFDLHHEWQEDDQHFNLLLSHIANFEQFQEFGMDLSLAGDTHGGQIRLPWLGAIYTDTWFPEKNGAYVKGLYEENGRYLFISSGLGSSPIPFRLCNRPEIAIIEIQPV